MQNDNELFFSMITADIAPEKQCALIDVFLKLCQRANQGGYVLVFPDVVKNLSIQLKLSEELIDELLDILDFRAFLRKEVETDNGNKSFKLTEQFKIEINNDDEFIQKSEELQTGLKNWLKDRRPSRISGAPEGTFE
jgi:hypothetical protein